MISTTVHVHNHGRNNGGLVAARRAAGYGARTLLDEPGKLGAHVDVG